jgi:hypothetical protein
MKVSPLVTAARLLPQLITSSDAPSEVGAATKIDHLGSTSFIED